MQQDFILAIIDLHLLNHLYSQCDCPFSGLVDALISNGTKLLGLKSSNQKLICLTANSFNCIQFTGMKFLYSFVLLANTSQSMMALGLFLSSLIRKVRSLDKFSHV